MTRGQALRELGRPIAYYPGLARLIGVEEAIFFLQLLYWSERTQNGDGWVFKSSSEWELELAISYKQQLRVRHRLKEIGVLQEREEKLKHRVYFKIDWHGYEAFLAGALDGAEAAPRQPAQGDLEMDVPSQSKGSPPYAQIYALLGRLLPQCKATRAAPARDRNIKKFWRDNGKRTEPFETLAKLVNESDYLNSRGGHTFPGKLDLNWIFNPEKTEKIMAGSYANEAMSFALAETGQVTMLREVWNETDGKRMNVPVNQIGNGKAYLDTGRDAATGLPKVARNSCAPIPEPDQYIKLMTGWFLKFRAAHGFPYAPQEPRDSVAAAALLKVGAADDLLALAQKAWALPNDFHCAKAATLHGFAGAINDLRKRFGFAMKDPDAETAMDAEWARFIAQHPATEAIKFPKRNSPNTPSFLKDEFIVWRTKQTQPIQP